jgi:hypothetical protein
MATFIDLATDIMVAITRALVIINGSSHGILQGTNQAVLAEAQGATLGPTGFSHLADLQNTLRAITTRETELNSVMNQLSGDHPNLGFRVRGVLKPLFDQLTAYRTTMVQTEKMAGELAQTNGTRLSGVNFGLGGAGPEVGRTSRALISTQMQQRASELAARGVSEPSRLIPSARSAGNQVMNSIRQLPISTQEAAQKVTGIIGAIRFLLTQAARQALVSGNLILSQALNSVERALINVGQAAVRAGGRLNTPIIVIDIRGIKRSFGILDPDDA